MYHSQLLIQLLINTILINQTSDTFTSFRKETLTMTKLFPPLLSYAMFEYYSPESPIMID